MLKVSNNLLKFIEEIEGFRSHPYKDTGGVWTIGIGFTFHPSGKQVEEDDEPITKEDAHEWLKFLLDDVEKAVNKLVKSKINQNQFDALCSFVYNVGTINFKLSTILKFININPNGPGIEEQFLRWDMDNGKHIPGLKIRRQKEFNLYNTK